MSNQKPQSTNKQTVNDRPSLIGNNNIELSIVHHTNLSDILIKCVKNNSLTFTLSNIKTGYLLSGVAYTEIPKSIECLYRIKFTPLTRFIKPNGVTICREFSFASVFANYFCATLIISSQLATLATASGGPVIFFKSFSSVICLSDSKIIW